MAKDFMPSLYITGKPATFGHFDVAPEVRRVQGAGCRVQGSGCRVEGSGFRVQG